jgi:hypothetical protein
VKRCRGIRVRKVKGDRRVSSRVKLRVKSQDPPGHKWPSIVEMEMFIIEGKAKHRSDFREMNQQIEVYTQALHTKMLTKKARTGVKTSKKEVRAYGRVQVCYVCSEPAESH